MTSSSAPTDAVSQVSAIVAPFAASGGIGGYTSALWISVSIAVLALISSFALKTSPQARAR